MGAMIHREELALKTKGETQVLDLTESVRALVRKSGVREGTVHLFVPGSTAGLTTIELEPGCLADLRAAFERVAPREGHYDHNERWGDGNGFSHVRAALLGPSITVPVGEGAPLLGMWQQIVLVDFDNRARDRKIVATVMGE
jgi:secondary thiamine-phosphate synthase enzyme